MTKKQTKTRKPGGWEGWTDGRADGRAFTFFGGG